MSSSSAALRSREDRKAARAHLLCVDGVFGLPRSRVFSFDRSTSLRGMTGERASCSYGSSAL